MVIGDFVKNILACIVRYRLCYCVSILRQSDRDPFLSAVICEEDMPADSSGRSPPPLGCGLVDGGIVIAGITGNKGILIMYTGEGIRIGEGVFCGDSYRIRYVV